MRFARLVSWFLISTGTTLLAQANPVPLNQPLVPTSVTPGGPGFMLTVNGTGFVPGVVVNWSGTRLATNWINGSQLMAAVPASDLAAPHTAWVTVVNPGPGGGSSGVHSSR